MMDFSAWPRLLVVDVEGDGHNPPGLVEVATVPIAAGQVQVERGTCVLIRPPQPITVFARRVHHISDAQVADCPPWAEVSDVVRTELGTAWIAAHNAGVDHRVLSAHLPGWSPGGVIDTLRLCRALYPDAPSHTLDAMLAQAEINLDAVPGQRHRAGFDAHATALLLLALAASYDSFATLAAAAAPGSRRSSARPTRDQADALW